MKINHLPLIVASAAILLFSSYTLMYPTGAPAAKTGSPGDGSNCTSCHGGTATTTPNCITTTIPVSGYVAGQVYAITATNPLTGSGKYGFEVSPQNVAGTQLGTLAAGSGSQLVGGTKYVTHTNANSSTKVWTFNWTAPAAGTGPVTFYAAFAKGANNNVTLSNLTVQEAAATPAAAGPISGPTTGCANGTATYSIATIAGATSYVWTVTGASISSGAGTTSITVSFGSSATTVNLSVYGSNSAGNGAPSNLSVTVNAAPAATSAITGSATPCQTSSQTYSVTNVSGVSYNWTVPSGSSITSGQGTNSINVTVGGTNGDISVVPSNNCGAASATVLPVTVSPAAAQTSNIIGSGSPCQSSTQTYSVTQVSGITYDWTVPSGSSITSGQGTNSINITVGGNSGNVSVIPSNACGAGPATNLPLNVGIIPSQTSSISGSATPCQSTAQNYSVNNVTGVNYSWTVPSGAVINSGQGTNAINVTLGSSSGNVSVTPSNSCGNGNITSLPITIALAPTTPSTPTGPDQVDLRLTTSSDYTTSVGATSYAWKLSPTSAGSISGTTSSSLVTWSMSFLGAAEISVKGQNACGESSWSMVKTTQVINTTSVEVDKKVIDVTVDNVQHQFILTCSTANPHTTFIVVDLTGKELMHADLLLSGIARINHHLNPGIYLVEMKNSGVVYKKKLALNW